jgi:SH3-like domain-containing protein
MKYEVFRIINNKDLWVKVKDEFGSTGWIFEQLLWIQ